MNAVHTKTIPNFHVRYASSAFDAGYAQGQVLKNIPGWVEFFGSGAGKLTPEQTAEAMQMFARYCPWVNAEITGLAQAVGIPAEAAVYYAFSYLRKPEPPLEQHCSHIVMLPSRTADGHVLVGRNYDFSPEMDDLTLVTKRIDGCFATMGFASVLFGLLDGMNEHGLAVTMSAGGMPVGPARQPIQDGFQFWVLVRLLLETCRDVDEALRMIAEVPLAGNPNLLLADRSGCAALVELHGPDYAVKRIDASSPEQALYSTNHYRLEAMQPFQVGRKAHSVNRAKMLERLIASDAPVSRADLKRLLATQYPDGLCCHYYDEYFGTLHSQVMDLTAGEMEVCFGSPAANPYHTLTLDSVPTGKPYMACLPMESAAPEFWETKS